MKKSNLPLPKAALIQLILFVILFFLNIYSFFSEDGVELITMIITVIVVVSMLLGLSAFWVNRKQLFKDKKVNTLEIVSLVSLGLLTLISILSSFSALVVWIVVGGSGVSVAGVWRGLVIFGSRPLLFTYSTRMFNKRKFSPNITKLLPIKNDYDL